jgi:glucose/arabinose dehydrogenase
MTLSTATSGLALLLLATSAQAQSSCDINDLEVSYPAPVVADGWSYRLVAEGFTKPRGILFDSDGALLVVDSGVGLLRLTLRDNNGTCLAVDENTTLLENEDVSVNSCGDGGGDVPCLL